VPSILEMLGRRGVLMTRSPNGLGSMGVSISGLLDELPGKGIWVGWYLAGVDMTGRGILLSLLGFWRVKIPLFHPQFVVAGMLLSEAVLAVSICDLLDAEAGAPSLEVSVSLSDKSPGFADTWYTHGFVRLLSGPK
jgi:hypothetical protein